MKNTRKWLALVLTFALALSLTLPAMATGTGLTATPTGGIKVTVMDNNANHTMKAYQIFSGTYPSDNTLVDVVWGSAVTNVSDAFWTSLAAIQDSETGSAKPFEALTRSDNTKTAASIADVLDAYKDNTYVVEAFQNLVYGTFIKDQTNVTSTALTASDPFDGTYSATGLAVGYYLITDEVTVGSDAKVVSMLQVVGNAVVEVDAKLNVPSVKKYAGEETVADNATFAVGQKILYTVVGTTPNFDKPENDTTYTYQYEFTDTFDAALSLVYESVNANANEVTGGVLVTLGAPAYDQSGDLTNDITNQFVIRYVEGEADKHVLTLTAANLAAVDGISADSEIYVTYYATINSSAQTNTVVNNTIQLTTQKDTNGETETPTITESVYPLTATVTKVDGEDNTTLLEGAEFKLYYEGENDTKYYATVAGDHITGWVAADEIGTGTDQTSESAVTLKTDENGKFTLIGLGANTQYWLEETKAPTGYNKLNNPVGVKITAVAQKDGTTVDLKTLTYDLTVDKQVDADKNGDATTGTIALQVTNNKGAQLPSTGGIGTTIFYVVGGALVLGAVVLLVTKKRMSEE